MTRAGEKVPFPIPAAGVISDQHPFAVGHGNLLLSQNWWEHDGIFRTRNGLISAEPPKRWYEELEAGQNLFPELLAECDSGGLALLTYDSPRVEVTAGTADVIAGDHQFTASLLDPGEDGTNDVYTDAVDAEPGLPYTIWVFSGADTVDGDLSLEFLDEDSELIESHDLAGDAIDQGLWVVSVEASPVGTVYARLAVHLTQAYYPDGDPDHDIVFGPMKLVQGEEIIAWSPGDGYAETPDQNLFPMEVAHPETTQEAMQLWDLLIGRESPICYQGGGVAGLFDGYEEMPFAGRAIGYTVQPSQVIPAYDEVTGLVLKEDYRVAVSPSTVYRISASFFFDVEVTPLQEMVYTIEGVYYNAAGDELDTLTIATSGISGTPGSYYITTPRGRDSIQFVPPALTTHLGLRIKCLCPTAKREIVYDNAGHIVYDNHGQIVTTEDGNLQSRRLGIILDDVKLVEAGGSSTRWWDFELPVVEHTGPYAEGEFPLNYLLHDYLYEGTTEANRIVMASDKSLWKWNDTLDEWEWIGFDLETLYSAFYLVGENEDGVETHTLDERIVFEQTEDEGYTSQPGEPDELLIEITLPAAAENSTTPYPGQSWKYRVNGGDWSSTYNLLIDPPILEAFIEIDYGTPRTLPIKIVLDVEGHEDFEDVCVFPDGETLEDPVFSARIFTRRSDEEVDETLFHTDRDGPVELRGYDFGAKTWIICANPNDRVTAWDGQDGSKVERAGTGSPYARTICVSGGRVLAGNVRFDDPGTDLIAPLAVVYTDTFLARGFRNWHPELAIRLADTPGEIVKLLEMGTLAVACYKTDALYMLVYQTGNNPFRTQLMASNIAGPIGTRAVAALTENSHLYVGEDGGVYVFDGTYPRNFSGNISRTIQSELDLNYKDRAFLVYTPRLNCALAMYPTKGSDGRVNRGMWIDIAKSAGWPFEWNGPLFDFTAGAPVRTISNYQMGGVTIRMGSLTSVLAEGQTLQPDFFMGVADGTTYVMDENAADDWGYPVRALLRSGLTEFGLQDRYSVLREMEFMFNRTNTPHEVDVEIWAADHGFDARPVSHETLDIFEEGPYFAEVREKARFFGYGLTINALEQIYFSGAFGSVRRLGRRKS